MGKTAGERKGDKRQHICVAARCRPMNQYEMKMASPNSIDIDGKKKEITVRQDISFLDKGNNRTFQFDQVFGPKAKQIDVYRQMVAPVVEEVLQGYNCTIFAYGQTGTGKTFTMEGEHTPEGNFSWQDDPLAGIIPRALHQLFSKLNASEECAEFSVTVSYLEIYNEELFDLLGNSVDPQKLRIFEDPAKKGAVRVHGLEEVTVHSRNEVFGILEKGTQRRQTAATLLNAHSSRSHSLFMVTIHMKENNINGEEFLKTGKLNLVDLAGSENIGRSGAVEKRAREAGTINQSLLTLGRVITALVENTPHIPYRESKLTRLLKDSLGGHTKTSIIATVSPAACNLEETLSTLDYASRAKNITNKPEVNQKLTKKALIKEYTEQIEKLKRDLNAAREKNGIYVSEENYQEMQNQISMQKNNMKEFMERIEALEEEKGKVLNLFSTSQKKLENTNLQLKWTKQEVSEKSAIIESQKETEEELYEKGSSLLETINETVSDNTFLQQSLSRKRNLQEANLTAVQLFKQEACAKLSDLTDSLNHRMTLVETYQQDIKSKLGNFREEEMRKNEKLRNFFSSSENVVTDKLEELMSDQFVLREGFRNESSLFSKQFDEKKTSCLDTVEKFQEESTGLRDKFQLYVNETSKRCDELLIKVENITDFFCSTLNTMMTKHENGIKELSDTVNNHICTEKEMLQQVSRVAGGMVTQQQAVKKQLGEDLETAVIADLQHSIRNNLDKLFETREKQLKENVDVIVSDVCVQVKNTEEMELALQKQQSSLNDNFLKDSSTFQQTTQTYSEESVKLLSSVRTGSTQVNTEIKELGNVHQKMHIQVKSNIDDFHKTSIEYDRKVTEVFSKSSKDADAKAKDLVSVNGKVMEEARSRISDKDITNEELLEQMDKQEDETHGQYATLCNECNTKIGGLEDLLVEVVDKEIKVDAPTGSTPKPKKYAYPQRLRRTEDHGTIINNFRQKTGSLPLPDLREDGEFVVGEESNDEEEINLLQPLNTSSSSQSTQRSIETEEEIMEEDEDTEEEFNGKHEDRDESSSPYPTPVLRKTKQTNAICIDGKENAGVMCSGKKIPLSASKIPRTPLGTSNQ